MVGDVPASLGCPACQAPAGHQCRRRDGRTRLPHTHRVALAAAALILTWISERFLTADLTGNLLVLIETEHTLGPHRAARRHRSPSALFTDDDRRRAPQWEREMLLLAAHQQANVAEILAALDGRSLTLKHERTQADDLHSTVTHLRRAIEAMPETEGDPWEPPTLRRLQQVRDRDLNAELATRAQRRDDHAQRESDPLLPPARWQVTRHDPNGVFEAHPLQADEFLGPRFGGWAPLPEAVPSLLRAWSVPAARRIEVAWPGGRPMTPQWLLPYGGRESGHRGDDPSHQRTMKEALDGLWPDHRDRHRARFAGGRRRPLRFLLPPQVKPKGHSDMNRSTRIPQGARRSSPPGSPSSAPGRTPGDPPLTRSHARDRRRRDRWDGVARPISRLNHLRWPTRRTCAGTNLPRRPRSRED
ncbi:hypothetical protein [Herbidospora sp. NBRC 101105]|uniref:zinc finger domain-containing protein n=1 Tax=Herbidospora sp. NBRC 101105 TaxID=3032195 RepID=UPI0024A47463|nr:hypothetical protein [Herbidospora sp. NBRC 101105]GLX99540.1 hypothetical protein Hesp01_74900 [Herbidospora sp. NBRC 101105]